MALLYRKSLDSGTIPKDWMLGRIVPIFKKGDRQDPGNYRPVSLTAVTCKVLESLIRDEIHQHLSANHLYADCQHGFRPSRSCSAQLVEAFEDWSKDLEMNSPVDVVYLDFQKAFDSVPHQRLLHKLKQYGVSGKLIAWIESFLNSRRQQVLLNGHSSKWTNVASGVPQGSVLGPLLFLLYVNDIPEVVHCTLKMHDTKLYSSSLLQEDVWQDDTKPCIQVSLLQVMYPDCSPTSSPWPTGQLPGSCPSMRQNVGSCVWAALILAPSMC